MVRKSEIKKIRMKKAMERAKIRKEEKFRLRIFHQRKLENMKGDNDK